MAAGTNECTSGSLRQVRCVGSQSPCLGVQGPAVLFAHRLALRVDDKKAWKRLRKVGAWPRPCDLALTKLPRKSDRRLQAG